VRQKKVIANDSIDHKDNAIVNVAIYIILLKKWSECFYLKEHVLQILVLYFNFSIHMLNKQLRKMIKL